MPTVYKYTVWCITEQLNVPCWGEVPPDKCPNNTAHAIDPTKTAIVGEVASNDVNIVASEAKLQVQQSGFPDYSGFPFFGDSILGVAKAGQDTAIYLSFDKPVRIQGGGFRVGLTAAFGDYMTADMTYGMGGPVVGVLVNKMHVWPDRVWERQTPDSQLIPTQILLRMTYHSVGLEDVQIFGWYDLRRTPNVTRS